MKVCLARAAAAVAMTAAITATNRKKNMLRKLYLLFGIGVIGIYSLASWFGWELANDGKNSRLGMPFVSGYRGGK